MIGLFAEHDIESRDQSLGEPERENQLRSSHEQLQRKHHVSLAHPFTRVVIVSYLGNEALEETRQTLVLGHVGQDPEAALGVLKVAVLDAGLDDVEGRGDDERCRGTGDGGDEVLEPGGLVVVFEVEEVLLGEGGAS